MSDLFSDLRKQQLARLIELGWSHVPGPSPYCWVDPRTSASYTEELALAWLEGWEEDQKKYMVELKEAYEEMLREERHGKPCEDGGKPE